MMPSSTWLRLLLFIRLRRSRPARRRALRVLGVFVAVQVTVAAIVVAIDRLRRQRSEDERHPGYPWQPYPEIELETIGDRARLFSRGSELYDAMIEAIEAARETIMLETFIWKDDRIGHRIREALERRARDGVQVYVITDGFANMVVDRAFRRMGPPLWHLLFREPSLDPDAISVKQLFRDHRKILVCDDDVAFVGGYNIDDRCADGHWRDTHLRLRGSCVRELHNAFVDFWNQHRSDSHPLLDNGGIRSWTPSVRVQRNDPSLRIFPVRAMYLEAIDRASDHVWMTQAYFVPDRAMRDALVSAARRGVDVQVILPWRSNHVIADWVARRHFSELLRAGVRIFGYRHLMIHAKTATIDGVWSTVGTANIDRLSLQGNYEVNVEVHSERLAAQMQAMFLLDRDNCTEIDYDAWRRRPLRARFAERALESLAPLV